jgi:hypothetical protein
MRPRIGVHPDDVPPVKGLVLYRLYTAYAEQLYIGMGHLKARLAHHKTKPWFRRIEIVTWDQYAKGDRKRLCQDELRAIVVNQPRYNGRGHKRHKCHKPARVNPFDDAVPTWQCDRCGLWFYHDGDLWRPFRDDRR